MRRILARTACIGAMAVAVACSGTARETPTPPSAPTAATATVASNPADFPMAPAYQDKPVWDFVREWQGANISPILHPASLPPGFDTVTVDQPANKRDPYLLSVEYSGPGKELRVLAGGINPPPPGRGGYQQEATVRGHDAVLEVTPGTDPGSGIWLWWTEPGAFADETGGAAADHVFYALYALGLTPQEVLQIAASLTASAP